MSYYVVTGGAGFIGSHLTRTLLNRGHRVTVVDNLSTGKRRRISAFAGAVQFVEADINSVKDYARYLHHADTVFHQAALPSVQRSVNDPLATNHSNINGTLQLLIAAKNQGVGRVVFASSSSVYGSHPELPKHEALPNAPASPYALSKLTGEHYCRLFTELYGLETVSLRYFNVFGPDQDPDSQYSAVIPRFIQAISSNQIPEIHGDGCQSRDFTYVDNVVHANINAAEAPGIAGMAFNIGCGVGTSVNTLLELISNEMNSCIKGRHSDPRPGDVRHSLADITRAQHHLEYEPAVDLIEGLRRTIKFFTNFKP